MKRLTTIYSAIFLILLIAGGAAAQDEEKSAHGTLLDIGVQDKDIEGSVEKFEEYREVRNGFLINDFLFTAEGSKRPGYLEIMMKNPLQDHESYRIGIGKHGSHNISFSYDAIPHNFSTGRLVLSGAGTGRLLIPTAVQSALQAVEQTRKERGGNPLTDTTGEDASAQAIVNDLYGSTDKMVFGLKRKRPEASLDYSITDDIKTWVKYSREGRSGTRVITTGTYERFAQGASGLTHTQDLFLVSGTELAQPIAYKTSAVSMGVGAYKRSWMADVEYTYTDFENKYRSLLWDDPFRTSDASATTSGDLPTDNGFNRGRFAVGQLALPPDSKSNNISLSGGADLPMNSRLSANIGYGWVTQDEPFIPYTQNSAISTVAGFDVTNTANLPKSNLDGKVKTLSQSYTITSRPRPPLSASLRYRYYDYKNETEEILFPGYAAFGESFWRKVRNDKNEPVENKPQSYTKQNIDGEVQYRIASPLTVKVKGGWEGWDREHRFIEDSREWNAGGSVTYKPLRMATLMVGYTYSDRSTGDYETGATAANPEAIGLVDFDLAERTRNKVDARVMVMPVDSLNVGAFVKYLTEDFAEDSRFGLKEANDTSAGGDIAYSPSGAFTIYTSYERQMTEKKMQAGAKDDAFNSASTALDDAFTTDNFNPLNYWNADIDEDIDTFGVGVRLNVLRNLALDASYNLSLSEMKFSTTNPNGTTKLANGLAQDWPSIENRLHEVRTDLGWKLSKRLMAGARYLYEKYELDSFEWDINAYMAGTSAENSTKFLFTDATYDGFEAHVGGIYLKYML